MAINLATKYASEVDEVIVKGSLTGEGVNNSYDFVGAQSVKVYTMGTAPLNDYNATGANRYGVPTELDDTVQEMPILWKEALLRVGYSIARLNFCEILQINSDCLKYDCLNMLCYWKPCGILW